MNVTLPYLLAWWSCYLLLWVFVSRNYSIPIHHFCDCFYTLYPICVCQWWDVLFICSFIYFGQGHYFLCNFRFAIFAFSRNFRFRFAILSFAILSVLIIFSWPLFSILAFFLAFLSLQGSWSALGLRCCGYFHLCNFICALLFNFALSFCKFRFAILYLPSYNSTAIDLIRLPLVFFVRTKAARP